MALGLAGLAVGCGSAAQQAPLAPGEGKAIREELKQARQQAAKERVDTSKADRPNMKQGLRRGQ